MATPPFDINATTPEDNGILSQHPFAARIFRDVTESWLLVNHNVQGRHDEIEADWQPDTYAGTDLVSMFWASTAGLGLLVSRIGTANIEALTFPPGTVVEFAGTVVPNGWVLVSGQALSRSGEARAFDVVGTVFGPGDGSSTWNTPDLRGRITAGMDNMGFGAAGRLTGATFGAILGSETHTLITSQLAVTTPAGTISAHTHFVSNGDTLNAENGLGSFTKMANSRIDAGFQPLTNYLFSSTSTLANRGLTQSVTEAFSGTPFGSDQPHNNVQPTFILPKIMKL